MARETILIQIPPGLDPVMASNWRKVADALRGLSKIQSDASSGGDSKGLVLVSVTDTTPDHLLDKVSAGANVTITQSHNGYDEKVSIASSDETVKVTSNDTTEGYLASKLIEGSDIDFVETDDGGNETLKANFKLVRQATAPTSPTDGMLWQDTASNGDLVSPIASSKSLVSSNDTTPGYLNGKLVAGSNITLTEGSDGANETLTIASTAAAADEKAKVSANDTTAGYLNGKLVAGTGITLTEGTDGGNETLTVASTIISGSFNTNFSIKMSGPKTVPNITNTKIDTFDTIVVDDNSEWDSTNKYWLCKTTGTYIINTQLSWTADATGYRTAYIYINGAAVCGTTYLNSGATFGVNCSCIYKADITAGKYVEIYGKQSSGHDLDALVAGTPVEWQIWRIK